VWEGEDGLHSLFRGRKKEWARRSQGEAVFYEVYGRDSEMDGPEGRKKNAHLPYGGEEEKFTVVRMRPGGIKASIRRRGGAASITKEAARP